MLIRKHRVLDLLKTRVMTTLLCLAGLLALVLWWRTSEATNEPVVSSLAVASPSAPQTAAEQSTTARGAEAPVAVDLSSGNKIDAARLFDIGFAGGLTVDRETRHSLEGLLMVMPQELSTADIEKLEATLRAGLPNEDAEKAIRLFHDYRGYQADMRLEMTQLATPENAASAKEYFDRIAQIQRRHFDDATASALFGQDNQNARLVAQAAFINRNADLSVSQKRDQLDTLRAQLPADQRDIIPDPEAEASVVADPQAKP